jgi:hypothetical protein
LAHHARRSSPIDSVKPAAELRARSVARQAPLAAHRAATVTVTSMVLPAGVRPSWTGKVAHYLMFFTSVAPMSSVAGVGLSSKACGIRACGARA